MGSHSYAQRCSSSFHEVGYFDLLVSELRRTDFHRPFNEQQISLIVYLSARDRCPYFLLRTYHMGGPWFALRGAHELCINREGSCLQLQRWSPTEGCAKLWASLCFMTWEGRQLSTSCWHWAWELIWYRNGSSLLQLPIVQGPKHFDSASRP